MARGSGKPGSGAGDDEALFAEAMRDVRRLERRSGPVVPMVPAPAAPAAPRGRRCELDVLEQWGERYALLAPGADRRLLRALRAGQPPPEASLDLHRRDSAAATGMLRGFVEQAHREGRRCLLVIHGRGRHSGPEGPVLRALVLGELGRGPLAEKVLAVANAPPDLGGSGAALVLLRRCR
jgi:DNA-nicking Smr family endonuclease